MKTKLILAAMVLPALFTACSNEEFADETSSPVNKAGLIEVGKDFSIAAVRGNQADTRSSWYLDPGLFFKWLPTPATTGGNSTITSSATAVNAPEIGLCWTGEGLATVSDVVYTNYKFIHNGWLATDEAAADFDKCDPAKLNNGWLYSEATAYTGTGSAGEQANYGITVSTKGAFTTPNFKSGVFKTENSTMFEGDYIVYYPYNKNFCQTAAIPATSSLTFSGVQEGADGLNDPVFGNSTFAYGKLSITKGGTQASGFGLENLSSLLSVQLIAADATAVAGLSQIAVYKVVLFNEAGFVKSVDLSAKSIKEGKKGQDLYCGNKVTNKTIVADLAANGTITATALKYYMPVLPCDVKNLKLLVYATETGTEKVAFVNAALSTGAVKIGAAEAATVKAQLTADDFKTNVYYAVDDASLGNAIAACTGLSSTNTAEINIIGDIELENDCTVPGYVTVKGDGIIVPEDKTLTLGDNSTMNSNITVKGMTCCGNASNGGKLVVNAATINSDVVIEDKAADAATDATAGELEFAADKTSTVTGSITNKGIATVVKPSANNNKTLVNLSGTFNNEGKLTIETFGNNADDTKLYVKEAGTFNNAGTTTVQGVLAIAGTATNDGEITDKVSSQVTGNITSLSSPGEYISEVDNNGARFDAALKERPTTIVKFVGTVAESYEMKKIATATAPIKKYVVEATGVKTTFVSAETAAAVTATLPALDVNSELDITIGTDADKMLKLVVTGEMNVNATTTVTASPDRDTEVLNVGTLNVKLASPAILTMSSKVNSTIGNLNIASTSDNTPVVAKFSANSITTADKIVVDKSARAEIVTATGAGSDVAGIVWYKTSSVGTDYWKNGIPTKK